MNRPLWTALGEVRTLWRILRERFFLVVVLLLFLLYGLVLQWPSVVELDVGAGMGSPRMNSFDHLVGSTFDERVGLPFDLTFLEGFYAEEQGADVTFRWSEPEARLRISGLARSPVLLRLRMHGAPVGVETTARLEVEGRSLAQFSVAYPLHVYSFALDSTAWSGDMLTVDLRSTPLQPGGTDTRRLGVALDQVTLIGWHSGWRPSLPPTALFLTGVAVFFYLGLRRAGLRSVVVAGCTLLCGLVPVVGLLITEARAFVAAYSGGLFLAAALSYPVLLITLHTTAALFWRGEPSPNYRAWRWLAVLFLLSFLLRFGGALSPRYFAHDTGFHTNRLDFAERGALFVQHSSGEAGLLGDPYPGALYLFLVPFTLLSQSQSGLFAFFLAWLGSWEVFLFWFLARQVSDERTGRWAALLYLAFPIAVAPYWVGLYTNLAASWLVMFMAVAVVLALRGRLTTSLLVWIPLFALFFLTHLGLVVLWVPAGLLWGVILYWRGEPRLRLRLRRLLAALLLGLAFSVAVYYSHYLHFFGVMSGAVISSLRATLASEGREMPSLLARTWAELQVWWRWGVIADYAGIGLFLGGVGLLLVGWGRRRRDTVMPLLVSIVVTALVFWLVSMLTFYFTRYMFFLLPVVALGSARVLSGLWQRGPAGRVVAGALLAYICGITLFMWLSLCLFGLRPVHVL